MSRVDVAGVQFEPEWGQSGHNCSRVLDLMAEAAALGVRLAVFPECALSGYVFDDLEAARGAAETVPGSTTETVAAACRRSGLYVVLGMLERADDSLYNSAILCGPEGLIGVYRKSHLPFLGVDKLVERGPGPLQVYETPVGRIGILICYDLRFPEAARCLALEGAEIIALPTNWPEGAEAAPDFIAPTRALENRVFVVAVNRAGTERGVRFIGKSQIVGPGGRRLALAESADETMIRATIDPTEAREKRLIISPGFFEIDTVGDRRPDLYRRIVQQNNQ